MKISFFLGDFNVETTDPYMENFMNSYNLNNLIKHKTCFKNPENPSCIDLILTNCPRSFHSTTVVETGLSDFHKLTVTVLKQQFQKQKPKVISYRDYQIFRNTLFRNDLDN